MFVRHCTDIATLMSGETICLHNLHAWTDYYIGLSQDNSLDLYLIHSLVFEYHPHPRPTPHPFPTRAHTQFQKEINSNNNPKNINFTKYSKHPHIRTLILEVRLIRFLYIGCLVKNQPEGVLKLSLKIGGGNQNCNKYTKKSLRLN